MAHHRALPSKVNDSEKMITPNGLLFVAAAAAADGCRTRSLHTEKRHESRVMRQLETSRTDW